jgi:hypothetical protein
VDPNSVSSVYGLAIRGDQNSTGTANQISFWDMAAGTLYTTSTIGFKANGSPFSNPTGQGDGYNTYLTMDTDGRGWVFRRGTGGTNFVSAYNSGWILNNGIWQANASMRAPIFYDSNDTGYWVDPANGGFSLKGGTSNRVSFSTNDSGFLVVNAEGNGVSDVRLGAAWGRPGVYGSSYLSLGTSGTYIEFVTSNSQIGYIDNSGNLYTVGSSRSPVFYDYNNSAYYLDPSSTGLSLKVAGNGEFYARSAAWAEGIKIMVPTTNTWGGIRFTRERSGYAGNWAIGFTGVDSSDDLTFWSNDGSAEAMRGRLTHAGTFTVSGDVVAYGSPSDINLKTNIKPLESSLEKVIKLQGVSFTWKEDTEISKMTNVKNDIGFIAQEVQEVLPDLVRKNENGLLSLRDKGITALLVEAIKDQQLQIEELKTEIEELKLQK